MPSLYINFFFLFHTRTQVPLPAVLLFGLSGTYRTASILRRIHPMLCVHTARPPICSTSSDARNVNPSGICNTARSTLSRNVSCATLILRRSFAAMPYIFAIFPWRCAMRRHAVIHFRHTVFPAAFFAVNAERVCAAHVDRLHRCSRSFA